MARLPYQVLVLPYHRTGNSIEFALFQRSDNGVWQGIAGGGEDGEDPLATAVREATEEGGIDPESDFMRLASTCTVPVVAVAGFLWGEDVLVIPEFAFGVEVRTRTIILSHEHCGFAWCSYEEAMSRLHWESNRTALWELHHRLTYPNAGGSN